MPRPFSIPWSHGRIEVTSHEQMLQELFFHGQYEPTEIHSLQQALQPGMVFIDVGANIGLVSLVASERVGPSGIVLALEPSSREFEKLERNIGLNRAANVRGCKVAVSDSAGNIELKVAQEPFCGHNATGNFVYESTSLAAIESVEMLTIDQLVASEKLKRVDLIKIDIEGGELAALRGARETLERFHPTLLVEVADSNESAVAQFLSSYGYSDGQAVGSLTKFLAAQDHCPACGEKVSGSHDCAADASKWEWIPSIGWMPKPGRKTLES